MTKRHTKKTGIGMRTKRINIMAFAILGGATLAGCDHRAYHEPFLYASDHRQRHMIEVVKKPQAIKIRVSPDSGGLSSYQARKVRNFLSAYANNPQGRLVIKAPSQGVNELATQTALKTIRGMTKEFGLSTASMKLRTYYADGEYAPPIRMYFDQHIAIAPECEDWSENLAEDRENLPYPNFGCASQRNLAKMVANPRDLIKPRGHEPGTRPSDRRDVTYEKYRKGEVTGADKSDDEEAKVSDATN